MLIAKGGTSAPGTVKLRATTAANGCCAATAASARALIAGTRGAFSLGLTVKP